MHTTRQIGKCYEAIALNYLRQTGLHFIAANVNYRVGELDLIMRDRLTWIFVEVRYRKSASFGDAAASINQTKRQRLLKAAAIWLAARGESLETADCRFDVVAITGKNVEWIQNALDNDAMI